MVRNPILIAVPKPELPVTIVVQIKAVENDKHTPTCIICLDSGNDVMKNTRCSCVYHIHKLCLEAINPKKCPLCRKDIKQSLPPTVEEDETWCCLFISVTISLVFILSMIYWLK